MTVSVSHLRKLTNEAIERNRTVQRQIAELEAANEARKQLAERNKAQEIIGHINERAEVEARAGRNHALIMGLGYRDYNRPLHAAVGWNICDESWLIGTAKMVFEYCVQEGLNPTLEFWHDGVGEKSGFNIVIHW